MAPKRNNPGPQQVKYSSMQTDYIDIPSEEYSVELYH